MSDNLLAVLYTLALIFGCLALAYLISRKSAEAARKIVHIGVAQWYFIYVNCFTDSVPAVIGLAVFALINGILNLSGGLSVLMGQSVKKRNWGLVWYPISFIIIILLCDNHIGSLTALGCAMLGMGWGDGLAALLGRSFGKRRVCGAKTWLGFFTLFFVVFLICILLTRSFCVSLAAALSAAVLEVLTPFGLDNLSVPLGIYTVVTVLMTKCEALNGLIPGLRWEWSLFLICILLTALAVSAVKMKLLTVTGGMAAFFVGLFVICGFRFRGLTLLMAFFVSSNLAGKLRKKKCGSEQGVLEEKNGCRDHVQVAANGLFAAISAVVGLLFDATAAILLFSAAVAEATSDTWAGELGRISKRKPISVLTGKPVEKGMSGGVTLFGTIAGFAGSGVIALLTILLFPTVRSLSNALIITCCGFAGCILDSVFGDRFQALYLDTATMNYCEGPDPDGVTEFSLVRGVRWMNNDAVNVLGNAFSFLLALVIYLL